MNRIIIMYMKVAKKIITYEKRSMLSSIISWDITSTPTSPTKQSTIFTTHMIIKLTKDRIIHLPVTPPKVGHILQQ